MTFLRTVPWAKHLNDPGIIRPRGNDVDTPLRAFVLQSRFVFYVKQVLACTLSGDNAISDYTHTLVGKLTGAISPQHTSPGSMLGKYAGENADSILPLQELLPWLKHFLFLHISENVDFDTP